MSSTASARSPRTSRLAADAADPILLWGLRSLPHGISYLPDLQTYLADLLRSHERLTSAFEADGWAHSEAVPSDEEIRRVRRLIARAEGPALGGLSAEEEAQVQEAVAVVRRSRSQAQ